MDAEKANQLMVNQQAQYVLHLHQLAEMQSRQQEMIGQLVTLVGQVAQSLKELGEAHQHTDQSLKELAEHTEQRLKELTETQQNFDHNLSTLIRIVDDLIRRESRGE